MGSIKTTVLLIGPHRSSPERWACELKPCGIRCVPLGTWEEAERLGEIDSCEGVVLCLEGCPEQSSRELIAMVRDRLPEVPLVVITSAGDAAMTRYALRSGAWDCLEVSSDEVLTVRRLQKAVSSLVSASEVEECKPAPRYERRPMLSDHRAFLDGITRIRSLCRRQGKPISIMMFDLDHFRHCNERFSTDFGDHVLEWFATTIRSVCRSSDLFARYECDRFIIAMPDANESEAIELADRCRKEMLRHPVVWDGANHELTACAGIVESTVGFLETEHQLVYRGRIALDHAKQTGSNETVTWSQLVQTGTTPGGVDPTSIDRVTRWVGRVREELKQAYLQSTRALVAAAEAKDPFALAHSLKVSNYAEAIAKRMKLPAPLTESIRTAAFLHDVGKIGVPDAILVKPGRLNAEEYEIVRRHPATGMHILGHVSFLTDELPLVLHHHERHDGEGYPAGVAGRDIPIGARVIAVADALEVMLSNRSYKKPYGLTRVRGELHRASGSQFDPAVVSVALEWLDEMPPDGPEALGGDIDPGDTAARQVDWDSFRSTAGNIPSLAK